MPRMRRIVLPNYPNLVVQRGHNRQCSFVDEIETIQGLRVELPDQGRPRRNPGK